MATRMGRTAARPKTAPLGLRWTKHPLVDMGLAAIILEADCNRPEEITQEHWRVVMQRLKKYYANRSFDKPSGILFTLNAPFTNPAYSKKPEERTAAVDAAFAIALGKTKPQPEPCTFFSDRRACVRAARDQVPMLMGRDQMNFYAMGASELPLSDLAYGCLLALPLATPVISGKMAIVAADDPYLLLTIADGWRRELRAEYAMQELSERKGIRTRVAETLNDVFIRGADATKETRLTQAASKRGDGLGGFYGGLSLYHLSNSGNGPGIAVHHYRPFTLRFLRRANSGLYHPMWTAFVAAYWLSASGRTGGDPPLTEERAIRKNAVLDRMTNRPEEAHTIIRFFVRFAENRVGRRGDLKSADVDLWTLVELFLEEILTMRRERIERTKALADALADEIDTNRDKRLLGNLLGITPGRQTYLGFRAILMRAVRERLKRQGDLLLTTDDYLTIFESVEELPDPGWTLARDLLRLRCLEELHRRKYFEKEPDALATVVDEDEGQELNQTEE